MTNGDKIDLLAKLSVCSRSIAHGDFARALMCANGAINIVYKDFGHAELTPEQFMQAADSGNFPGPGPGRKPSR